MCAVSVCVCVCFNNLKILPIFNFQNAIYSLFAWYGITFINSIAQFLLIRIVLTWTHYRHQFGLSIVQWIYSDIIMPMPKKLKWKTDAAQQWDKQQQQQNTHTHLERERKIERKKEKENEVRIIPSTKFHLPSVWVWAFSFCYSYFNFNVWVSLSVCVCVCVCLSHFPHFFSFGLTSSSI